MNYQKIFIHIKWCQFTYISLLIIPCMIVYVTNNKEPWKIYVDNSYFEQNLLLSHWQSMWISGHDTGISNFNTLKNINIKVPVNWKLQLTSVLWCISKRNGILNKGRGFIVVHLHSTICSKQIHGWVGVVKNICLLRLTSHFTASGSCQTPQENIKMC